MSSGDRLREEIAVLLLSALEDLYAWAGHDYPDWPVVEVAIQRARDAGIATERGEDDGR